MFPVSYCHLGPVNGTEFEVSVQGTYPISSISNLAQMYLLRIKLIQFSLNWVNPAESA